MRGNLCEYAEVVRMKNTFRRIHDELDSEPYGIDKANMMKAAECLMFDGESRSWCFGY